jgi:hypothetical protein
MALDLTRLSAAAAIRLLNSTRLGRVVTERQLYRHRMAAGLRIGDEHHVHLVRYARWLIRRAMERDGAGGDGESGTMAKQKQAETAEARQKRLADAYELKKANVAAKEAAMAKAGQEIGRCPEVVDPARRDACAKSFRLFCETYLAKWFYLGWSPDHLRAIERIEEAVLKGRLFAFAMPRGSGKTALCLAAVLWALLYGYHRYVCLIAATEKRARKLLQNSVYSTLEQNELLFADFPKVCHPIRKLERTPQRAPKQCCQGRYTSILWTKAEIVLPTVEGSPSSGAIITACGLTGGEVLGQNKTMPDGSIARPSLVLIDDPQTRGSAKSVTQCEDRLDLLQGGVLGMAGPDQRIAGFMACTVIRPGDVADQILDQEQHPDWQGERTSMVIRWPDAEEHWEEYLRLRKIDPSKATAYYAARRAAMDAGGAVSWPERFDKDCLSAIQHAYNLRAKMGLAAFASECQNRPLEAEQASELLTAEEIARRCNGVARGTVPRGARLLTLFIDVHDKLLYWALAAWADNFTGYVVDYGSYPDQRRTYWTKRDAKISLRMKHPETTDAKGAIAAGLDALLADTLARTWPTEDGGQLAVARCLIDTGYERDVVLAAAVRSGRLAQILPSRGLPLGPQHRPLAEHKHHPGDREGWYWRIPRPDRKAGARIIQFDANHWKSFIHTRLAAVPGAPGSLTLFGLPADRTAAKRAADHRLIADHLLAELPVETTGHGRTVHVWQARPGAGDENHLLDCLVGCAVAASELGAAMPELGVAAPAPASRRKRYTQADLRRHA